MSAIQTCSYIVASTYIFSLVQDFTDLVLQCYIVITLIKPQNVLHNTYYIHVEVFHGECLNTLASHYRTIKYVKPIYF